MMKLDVDIIFAWHVLKLDIIPCERGREIWGLDIVSAELHQWKNNSAVLEHGRGT